MKRFTFALGLALVCASTAAAAQAPPVPRIHNFNSVAISPDGTRVVSVETTDPGPDATALPATAIVVRSLTSKASVKIECPAKTECRLSSPVWAPDGSRFAYLQRELKTGTSSIWTAAAGGSGAAPWLASYKGVIGSPRWAGDGKSLAILATADALKETGATQAGAALVGDIGAVKVADVQRIAVLDAEGSLHYVSPEDLFVYEYDWIPSGNGFVATGAYGNGDDNWWIAKLYAIDAAGADARVIYTPKLQINAPRVSPDGKTVAFIEGIMSDFGSVGGDLMTVPITGGVATDLTPDQALSVNSISWAPHGDRLLFTALAGEATAIESLDLATKRESMLWSAPESISAGADLRVSLAADGSTSALVRQTFEQPPEIYAGPLGKWAAVTSDNAALAPSTRAQSITWTNEGLHVQGWLLAPRSTVAGRKYPMIVEIHGGPSAAVTPRFVSRGTDKDLLDHGYYLFYPNPRGSFGQGERFTAANVKDFGYGDLRDILAGIDAVEKLAPVDEGRLGVGGFSYGGYMTMWTVTQSHRFKAAFAGAGIANWQSYYGQNGIDKWMLPFFGASVYDDPAVYARSSPINYIKNVKTPTFVFVGERDVECPMAQSLEFWHALDTLGVPVSLVVYPGEGHGIRRPEHTKDINKRIIGWLDKYLGP